MEYLLEKNKIIFEDEYLIIYDKPSGINSEDISPLICHRLDKETSGLLIVAKNENVKEKIQLQFKKRTVKKKYVAIVSGEIKGKEEIEGFVFRDKKNYQKRRFTPGFQMSDFKISGKQNERYSKTLIVPGQIIEKKIFKNSSMKDLNYISFVDAYPETGRTHQIRLHLASIHRPILGDNLYGGKIIKKISEKLNINRLMLHATEIHFNHPITQTLLNFKSEIPVNFKSILL
jgi:RluA family pseudouridine synthase